MDSRHKNRTNAISTDYLSELLLRVQWTVVGIRNSILLFGHCLTNRNREY